MDQLESQDGVIEVRPFQAMEMAARAKALAAGGQEICHLETGEPAAAPAPQVREAVTRALQGPQAYTQSIGRIELRRALGEYYQRQHGLAVDPKTILVTMGSSAAFILAFLTAFVPGSAIALTRPGYPAYLNILAGLGYRAVEIPLQADNGWRLTANDIEKAYARHRFSGLLFASPANPTGACVDREEMAAIVATCARLGVTPISDEIYHGLEFGAPSVSAAEFTDAAIIINSFSKYYCMTGWRVGWMVLPGSLMRRATTLQQSLFIAAPTLSQIGAEVALDARAYYDGQKALYRDNQRVLGEGLAGMGFGALHPADGAFYAYADISRFSNDAMGFCRNLLETAGVATTPGVDFDRTNGHRFVRFSYAGSREMIEIALERMADFLASPAFRG